MDESSEMDHLHSYRGIHDKYRLNSRTLVTANLGYSEYQPKPISTYLPIQFHVSDLCFLFSTYSFSKYIGRTTHNHPIQFPSEK